MEKKVYQGNYITVTEEEINGHTWERMYFRGGVKVYPIQDNKILLIKEYRTHEKSARWKAIGGWMDKDGKDYLDVAKEELAEEAGLQANSWKKFYQSPDTTETGNRDTVHFIAENLSELDVSVENPDDFIIEDKKFVDEKAFFTMLDNHEINWDYDALVIMQIFRNHINK